MSKILKNGKIIFFVSTDKWSLLKQSVSLGFAEKKKGEMTGKREKKKEKCKDKVHVQ